MSNKLILLILMTYTAFFISFSSYADKNNVRDKLKNIKENITIENKKKEKLISYLNKINYQIKETDIEINNIEKKIIKINQKKSKLKLDLEKIRTGIRVIDSEETITNKILQEIVYKEYSINDNHIIYKILNSKSNDIFIDTEITKYISRTQKDELDLYQINRNIESAKAKNYNDKIFFLQKLNTELEEKLFLLNTLEKKNMILAKKIKLEIENSKLSYLDYINKESDLLKLLNHPSTLLNDDRNNKIKGTLPWPINGKVSNNFNKYKFSNLYRWNGETIILPSSGKVRAVYSGKVIFSDWMKGYGMMIIIDHGKKLMSLYAHNKVLLKNKGDIVHKGEIISMSGQSGGNLINSLYFEIRQNGVPQNPHEWCNISNKFSLAQ
jgi:septal ring factor EnvC (AmiA/AmiB activator)